MDRLGRRELLSLTSGLALSIPLLGLSGCGGSGEAPGKTLRRSTSSEPRTLDPQLVSGNSAALVYDMFEGLLTIDASGKERPGLAERYDVSPDGLTYTFVLRDNLKWSDGKPITSEDVLYTYRRAVNPKVAARGGRSLFKVINYRAVLTGRLPVEDLGVSAPDARTVVIKLAEPAPYMGELIASSSLAIVPGHVIEKHGKQWTAPGNMVTAGAYKLAEVVPNTYVKLVRNPNYYEADQVKIEEVLYYGIANPATALTQFRAKELDIVFGVPLNRLEELQKDYARELHEEPSLGVFYILLNNQKAPTNDVRVREALSLAVQRDRMSKSILRGEGNIASGIVPSSMPDYRPAPLPFEDAGVAERQARARELLAAAGYTAAKPLNITYKFGGVEINRLIAVALQSMWEELGSVKVTLENVGASGVIRDGGTGDYEAMRYTYYALYSDPVAMLKLLETDNVMNISRYSSPKFDTALKEADEIVDPKARLLRLAEVEKLGMNEFPVIPIYYNKRFYLVSQKVEGWVDNVRGKHPTRFMSFKA